MADDGGSLKDLIGTDPEMVALAEKYKSPVALAKAYRELEKSFSGTIRVPADGASKEEWAKHWDKQGRPTSPDGYDLPTEGEAGAIELMRALAPVAHEAGLTKKQLRALADRAVAVVTEQGQTARKGLEDARQANEKALREKLGQQFEPVMAGIRKWMVDQFGAEQAGAFKALGLDSHPAMESILAEAALAAGPDRMPGWVLGGKSMEGDVKALAKKWMELNNSEPIAKGRSHPLYASTLSEIDAVLQRIEEIQPGTRVSDLLSPGDHLKHPGSPHRQPRMG